ncbi:MAG: PAS domain S-box protein, partial [Bacteroidota bacterium]
MEYKLEDLRYKALLDSSMDGYWEADMAGTILSVNETMCRMLEYTEEELIGKSISEIEVMEDPDAVLLHIEKIKKRGWDRFETKHRRKTGEIIDVEISVQYLPHLGGRTYCFLRDITERVKMEQSLIRSEERFNQVAQSSGVWIWEVDKEGRYTYVSPMEETILGYKPEEMVGKRFFYDSFLNDQKAEMANAALEVFARKENFNNFINVNLHKDGHLVILETSGLPILDMNNELIGYRGADRNVTDRELDRERIKASEEKFSIAFNNAPVLLTISNVESGEYLEVNDKFLEVSGFRREEVIGKTSVEIGWLKAEDRKRLLDILKENGRITDHEMNLYCKNGKTVICSYNGEQVTIESRNYLLSMALDITGRKLAEASLKESEYFFRESQRSASIGSYKTDFIAGYWESSEVLDSILGIDRDYNRNIPGWFDIVHPDD